MTEISFKGKEFVHNHHLSVPFRPLVPHSDKSLGDSALDGNLIIHGDNLHALKALLPLYAGKVDCVFIDPPYNTGNEGWCYNDNVNAPMIKEWLSANPIGEDDGLRHDKWCAMMWPRLRLLHDLLADNGSFWMTIDENEVHRARAILDELFGAGQFVATVIWHKMYAPKATVKYFSSDHDYLIVYAKNKESWQPNLLRRTSEQDEVYRNPDQDPRGRWRPNNLAARNYYSKGTYAITCPSGRVIAGPPAGSYWRVSEDKLWELHRDNRIWWGGDGNNVPAPKIYLSEVRQGRVPQTLWHWSDVGHTQEAKKEVLRIFSDENRDVFMTPKPTRLLQRVVELGMPSDGLILDSFAGSGTTAHAVLKANKEDDGHRRFILVEMESYADRLTAERVRRVCRGYKFTGNLKTELLRQRINWSMLQNSRKLLDEVQKTENLNTHEYDEITKTVKDNELIVMGSKSVSERSPGLDGSFTYCTLGEAIELDKILSGETLPSYGALGAVIFNMATNRAFDPMSLREADSYLGQVNDQHLWLIYKPDLDWLKSPEAALTLSKAKEIAATDKQRKHLVFAPARFVSRKVLAEQDIPVEFAPLPFALYRIDRS